MRTESTLWVLTGGALLVLIALYWGAFVPASIDPSATHLSFETWDLYTYFLPKFAFGTDELLAGRLPIWNRFEYAGMPFLGAQQPAVLYPPKILAFGLFARDRAMIAFLVLHYLLLAAGFALFARSQGLHPLGAFTGSVCWLFNAIFLEANYMPNRIASLVWLPLIFMLVLRIGRSERKTAVAWLGLVVALQLLAGYPPLALDVVVLVPVFAVVMYLVGKWPVPPWRSLPLLAAGFILGGLVAAAQLLPFLDAARNSARGVMADEQAALFSGVGPLGQVALVSLFSLPALAGMALIALRRRRAFAPALGLACCLAMMLFGWRLLRAVPGLSLIRHPGSWVFTLQFFLAWLVAVGADGLAKAQAASDAHTWTRRLVATIGIGCFVFFALLALGFEVTPAHRPRLTDYMLFDPEAWLGSPGLNVATGFGMVGGLLLALSASRLARPRSLSIVGLAAVACLAVGHMSNYVGEGRRSPLWLPESVLFRKELSRLADGSGGRLLSIPHLRHGFGMVARVETVFGAEWSLLPERFAAFNERLRLRVSDNWLDWRLLSEAEGLLDALDVEYVVVPASQRARFIRHGLKPSGRSKRGHALMRNASGRRRAFVVHAVHRVGSAEAALDRLLSPDFDPRREAIVEEDFALHLPSSAPRPATAAACRYASPTRIEMKAETALPGLLVLSQSWSAGWKAYVDDRPAKIHRVNYFAQGVELTPGTHRVRFEYRPWTIPVGTASSLLSLLGVGCWLVWSRRQA